MEENLMEKLLNDFNGTLAEFNELVAKNDYDGVVRVFNEVNRLLAERNGIVLDDREPQYDHVLHELLDKMTGIVEKEIIIDGVPGTRYYTNKQVEEMIAEAEKELEEITRMMHTYENVDEAAYAQARSDRSAIIRRISELKAALVEGQEYSTLTYIDPRLAELQEERARLLQEKQANLEEIARLRAEETPGIPEDPADQERLNEINTRLSELEGLFADLEGQINAIRGTRISELVRNFRAETERIPELEARRAELQDRYQQANNRVNETERDEDGSEYAIARSERSAIVRELSELDAEINEINQNGEKAGFLESLIENGDMTVGEALDSLEAQLYDGQAVDHSQEIAEIDNRIAELDRIIGEAEARIEGIGSQQISDIIAQRQENRNPELEARRTALEQELAKAGERVRETRGFDEQNAQARADYSALVRELAEVNAQINENSQRTSENRIPELEARLAELQNRLREAADRVRDTRGYDEQNAQARADYSAIVSEIASVQAQINEINKNRETIEILETFLPEVEVTENVLDPMDYTYMGRLSDEQIIRRLLSEQLHLSEEEINATIGEYSLVQAEVGAHDEYGEDNPISMRQLVRTQKVRQSLTVKEVSEKLEQEIAELEARKAKLQEELKKAGDRVRETRGFDEQNAQARADYSALVNEIAAIDAQIASLKARQTSLKNITGIKDEEDRIAAAKAEKEALIARKNELQQDSTRQENPEIREKINRLKEISGIAALERQLQQYREEYDRLQKEKESLIPSTPGKTGVDNSEKIAALEARNKEIDARIEEIDKEIESMSGVIPGKKVTERLDIEEEAHKVGDHIFKAAKIRRELAARNVSRDEFLAFYQAGLDQTNQQIDALSGEYKRLAIELRTVILDPEDPSKRIDEQLKEAEKAGDTELTTKLYEQMRKNFIAAGREEQLKAMGLDHEITSPEDVEKMKVFYGEYSHSVIAAFNSVKESVQELKENAKIFAKEIERIKAEKATIELAGNSVEELEINAENRKRIRKILLEATITPENKLTDEQKEVIQAWQDASERFLSKKTTAKYMYVDKDGVERVIDVDSIDDTYPQYARDIEFLGVPAYKENLEQISAWEQTQDPYVFGKDVAEAYEYAESQEAGAGKAVIERILADKQKYVETFNGIPNPHKVKYENWKTAGSTLKGMKPVSKDLPIATRAKNGVENVFRFLGIRAPKFTRIDEHGNKVSDIKGGLMTLGMDALVVGAVGVTTAISGPALPIIGYAAKGIVTVGNKIAARVEYARHKDEIDSNKPVIHQADSNAREVARKAYYRDKCKNNKFVAWVKAKSDKYFTRKRERETDLAIAKDLYDDYAKSEDQRTDILRENLEIAEANQLARLNRQQQLAMGANAYNDIERDPDAVDMDVATAAIARNAALEARKPGRGKEDVNPNSTVARKKQYVKEEGPVASTADINNEIPDVKAPVSAITAEQIYTGRKQHVDRLNRVLTVITAAGLKFGYTAWKDGFMRDDVIHHPEDKTTDTIHHDEEIIHHDAEYGEVEVTDYETQFDTSKTLEEISQNAQGKTMDGYYSVSGGLRGQESITLDGSEKITGVWTDDGSTWGTGLSDTSGLSAPEFTDRLADLNLIDSNGVLTQDVEVLTHLNELGVENIEKVFVSLNDNHWVRLTDLMEGLTKQVPIGSNMESQLITPAWDEIVPAWDEIVETVVPAWDETVQVFDSGLVVDAVVDGAIVGAGIGVADTLHEAIQTTYIDGATPGRPEEVTPEATDTEEDIFKKLLEEGDRIATYVAPDPKYYEEYVEGQPVDEQPVDQQPEEDREY